MTTIAQAPRQVLDRYYQAMRDKSADALADLYAEDAVHEFPFTSPGFPARFEGREQVREGYGAAWGAMLAEVAAVEEVSYHETADPGVIVAEQVTVVALPGGATMRVPGLLVLEVRDGLIRRTRDYIDALAVRPDLAAA